MYKDKEQEKKKRVKLVKCGQLVSRQIAPSKANLYAAEEEDHGVVRENYKLDIARNKGKYNYNG